MTQAQIGASLTGMDRNTGKAISGDDHLAQSIADILTTPIGTRPMRRDYGSLLFELIDKPLNAATRLLCVQAVAIALARWEPRIRLRQAVLTGSHSDGTALLSIVVRRTDSASQNALSRFSIPLP